MQETSKRSWFVPVLALILGGGLAARAQAPDMREPVQQAMSQLSVMNGVWVGEGTMMMPGGAKETSTVTETFTWKLDDTVLTVEGVGKADGEVVHHAFGVFSYDPMKREYKMASHLATGMSTLANFEVVEPNREFRWWFDDGRGGTIRYKIEIVDGVWNEKGAYSPDGETWMPFFEMNLRKQGVKPTKKAG